MIWVAKGVDGKNYGAGARIYVQGSRCFGCEHDRENQFMIAFDDEDVFFNRNIEFIPTPEAQ